MNTKLRTYKTNMNNEMMTLGFECAAFFLICMMESQIDVDWLSLGVHTTYLIKLILHVSLVVLCALFNYRTLKSFDSIDYADEGEKCYGMINYEKSKEDTLSNEEYKKLHWLSVTNLVITFSMFTYCFSCSMAYVLLYFFNL